jgi:hypothetical protein
MAGGRPAPNESSSARQWCDHRPLISVDPGHLRGRAGMARSYLSCRGSLRSLTNEANAPMSRAALVRICSTLSFTRWPPIPVTQQGKAPARKSATSMDADRMSTPVAVKAAMLCAEPTAPAWTTSDQQPRPTPTRPAATTVTTADPIAALRRPLRLPTLSQPHRVRSRGPTKSPRRSPRYLGMDPPTRPTAPGRGVTAGSMAAGTTPRCCGSPTPFLRPEPTRFLSWSDSTAARCGRDGERASPASQRRRGDAAPETIGADPA